MIHTHHHFTIHTIKLRPRTVDLRRHHHRLRLLLARHRDRRLSHLRLPLILIRRGAFKELFVSRCAKRVIPSSISAGRRDELLLLQLLKRDSDPNELDTNGRTPLHIAAAHGNKDCASTLISFGADPNLKDYEGSVPLWDAIVGKHESLIKLLLDCGASLASGDVTRYASYDFLS